MNDVDFRKYCIEYIVSVLTERDLLEQLAEEAAELSHAALKKIRADKLNRNYTPVDSEAAKNNLLEEIGDVLLVLEVLGLKSMASEYGCNAKLIRWAERLKNNEK